MYLKSPGFNRLPQITSMQTTGEHQLLHRFQSVLERASRMRPWVSELVQRAGEQSSQRLAIAFVIARLGQWSPGRKSLEHQRFSDLLFGVTAGVAHFDFHSLEREYGGAKIVSLKTP